jgi:hypothetical protein
MTRAALAEERRDEIDEWWEGGFLGAVPMASAHEERVRFAFHEGCRRAATRNSFGSSTLDRNSPVNWGTTEGSASLWATSSLWHRLRRQSHENRRPKGGLK